MFRVIGERILVKRDPETDYEGGLMLPNEVEKPPRSGTILAVGSKVEEVVVGERVFFNEYAGFFLEPTRDLVESDLIVMREDEILAVEVSEEDSGEVT